MRNSRPLAILAFAALLMSSACFVAPAFAKPGVLAEMYMSGGLGVHGPCFTRFTITTDGKFTYDDDSKAHLAGTLTPTELTGLQKAIKSADYSLLRETAPASTIRPSAGDGSDIVMTISRSGSTSEFREWLIPSFFKTEPVKTLKSVMDKHKPH